MLGQRKWDEDGNNRRTPYYNRRMSYTRAMKGGRPSYWDVAIQTTRCDFKYNRLKRLLGAL